MLLPLCPVPLLEGLQLLFKKIPPDLTSSPSLFTPTPCSLHSALCFIAYSGTASQSKTTMAEGEEQKPKEEEAQEFRPPPAEKGRRLIRRIKPALIVSQILAVLVILAGITTLVLWLVYRPHKPRFYVEEAAITRLNVSNGVLTSSMRFTVAAANPNKRLGLRYYRMVAFGMWRDEPITPVLFLGDRIYQGKRSIIVFTPVLSGEIPLMFPYSADEILQQEQYFGVVQIKLRMLSGLRFTNGGVWTSHQYHLRVTCDLFLSTKKPIAFAQPCHVHV